MKKIFAFLFAVVVCLVTGVTMAANVSVKKSSAVKKQEVSGLDSITSGSLIPGVAGLISNVSALTKQQQDLEASCVPTGQELTWVTNMVKEYAKTGADSKMLSNICDENETYKDSVMLNKSSGVEPCDADKLKVGVGTKDADKVWVEFPKPAVAEYCADGTPDGNCPGAKKKKVSNVYAIFNAIDFSEEDYTADEINMYTKFMEKAQKCAPGQVSAKKKEAYANFVKGAVTGAGTNTAGVWDAVGTLTNSGGGLSGVGSLAPTVLQFLGQ